MLAINEMTADAMLGPPDSDLWHNVDDLLHNVNDLMSRLDQKGSQGGSEAGEEQEEGDGVFFTHEATPSRTEKKSDADADDADGTPDTTSTELQVRSFLDCLSLC